MESEKELDYIFVLKAIDEIPFNVGKKLLSDFLAGNTRNEVISRHRLDRLGNFGSMAYTEDEISQVIDSLLMNGLVRFGSVNGNRFMKVLELTERGRSEISNPVLFRKKLAFNFKARKTAVTEQDREFFSALGGFLAGLNDEQKKAVAGSGRHIMCIAGAGSGKTTVLTRRIEFLIKYRSVSPESILAITFTRKARQEMAGRLSKADSIGGVRVETFNSFCEKLLMQNNDIAYDRQVRVMRFSDKVRLFRRALIELDFSIDKAVEVYFTFAQRKGKTIDQLAGILMNDCFFIRDYFKFRNSGMDDFPSKVESKLKLAAMMVQKVCSFLDEFMKREGLRDYADQLIDAIKLLREHRELVPAFEHVLIDEYQDVNNQQVELVDLLNPKNLFCVGDPRQSIFGWRGSDIRHILGFEEKYPDCEVITLTKNYRSTQHIVSLVNESIRNMRLPDLESAASGEKDVRLLNFESEDAEFEFAIQRILSCQVDRKEIFVLARTNRQLIELSELMRLRGISHIVRSDELRNPVAAGEGDVTLATIHAIKGMEADMVFVMGCTSSNFPCRGSEHPIVDAVAVEEYDKEEEERRLFYVAMSRARKTIYLCYSGKSPTSFINEKMKGMLNGPGVNEETRESLRPASYSLSRTSSAETLLRLKSWRRELSTRGNVAAFMILHDSTLMDIVDKMPANEQDLEGIRGLGPVKIMKYGKDILRIVNFGGSSC
ncbi:UvrD-helicase domain-containing protein [Candidatus Woesearchaeota archaeon]|nr:UvrD-helicase domain-containing protein [Candidatus Woesearchaeota archaeon]